MITNMSTCAKKILEGRYLLNGENEIGMMNRVAKYYSSNRNHYHRLLDYISSFWFFPSTPILANGGTNKGLPISCFLNTVEDDLYSIKKYYNECIDISAQGGGIGSYWGDVRSIGEYTSDKGTSGGIIPFLKILDSMTQAINQGKSRKGSSAVYIDIHHPEIEEFLVIRKPTGDYNRKCLNINHAVNITDSFMHCVQNGLNYPLISPKTKKVVKEIDARNIFQQILETRIQTGEPYLLFIDTVNKNLSDIHKKLGLKVRQSNLCSEIVLPTGLDHLGKKRTAVCCLSAVNLEYYDNWKENKFFIIDILRFLDNVLSDFIYKTKDIKDMQNSRYSAQRERSIGLGVMGFHSMLQQKNLSFESDQARRLNKNIFKSLKEKITQENIYLSRELGPCKDAEDAGLERRFTYTMSIQPTATISILCGETSPCVEPYNSNIYTQKTLSGNFIMKNKNLEKIINKRYKNVSEIWQSILEEMGSVQHLTKLTEKEKQVYKTAFEIDQNKIIDYAADRQCYIDQAQSINLFLKSDIDKKTLLELHMKAYSKKLKSLYYLRSRSIQRPTFINSVLNVKNDSKECDSCQ